MDVPLTGGIGDHMASHSTEPTTGQSIDRACSSRRDRRGRAPRCHKDCLATFLVRVSADLACMPRVRRELVRCRRLCQARQVIDFRCRLGAGGLEIDSRRARVFLGMGGARSFEGLS